MFVGEITGEMLNLVPQYFGWDFRPEMFNWGLVSFDYRCPDPTNDDRLCRKVALALPNVVWVHKKARSEHLLRR